MIHLLLSCFFEYDRRITARRKRQRSVSGKRELKGLSIDPDAVDPDDVEMLEDMIVAAVNEALRAAESDAASNMQKLTGGLGLPF